VAIDASELSGDRCVHVTIDAPDRRPQDLYFLRRGDILYGLSVTARARDAALLLRVRAGLHFHERRP
jgi:hypothetical protein